MCSLLCFTQKAAILSPNNVPANEFLNLEGDKISTSRNWAVWLHEYLRAFEGKQDVLRYVLTATAPETKDNDFTWKDFQTRNNSELVAILGNFVNRTMVLTQKYFEGKTPAISSLTEAENKAIQDMAQYPGSIGRSIDNYRFREALAELMNLARLGNKYLADSEPWKIFERDPARVGTILNVSLQICANLAILMEPFMPFSAEKLRTMMNLPTHRWDEAGHADLVAAGHQLNTSSLLFDKITDEEIQVQIDKLQSTKVANEAALRTAAPSKPDISYEDFSRMDIRVGTILTAEKVAKTKKLLKLTVDTGIDQRTVVSGIAEFHDPEKIVGQKVVILVNLAAREIKGILSQGMILMAENAQGELGFVTSTGNNKNGDEIR